MKKFAALIAIVWILLMPSVAHAQVNYQTENNPRYDLPIAPLPCNKFDPTLSCPVQMAPIYQRLNEPCSRSYEEFLTNPIKNHYWVEDPAITAQGKADERARQFLYWVISTNAVDEAPVLRSVWTVSSTIALFGVVLIAVIFGIGYIISQRTNYNFEIRIWPTLIKIGFMLLYIAFSAAIVFFLIQLSEVLMKFFYENLGGSDLFNIYFAQGPNNLLGRTEESYKIFYGCRDLNIRVNEGINAEVFLLKMTNVTYYVMGTMILLRKILLWFLLFVSPFLALLMPFIFIRNTGWIWIGVFFQWLFYGPLLTLFLGGMAKIWKDGIPFNFDFSRVSRPEGYVYPTGINIVYGGPAQRIEGAFNRPIGADNNGNYVDTFSEYVITLIMLWAVTFFPWWLLRIFRDYCCEGILAMKNILLAMYDQTRSTPPATSPTKPPVMPTFKVDLKTPLKLDIKSPMAKLGPIGTIKTSTSVDIAKALNLHMPRLTEIAKMETNTQMKNEVRQSINYLSNPVKAETPVQRQQFMNIRTELFNRAIKSDSVAHQILASTSSSMVEKSSMYKEVLRTIPQTVTIEKIVNATTSQPVQRIQQITNNFIKSITNNNNVMNSVAQKSHTSTEVVKNIMNSYQQHISQPVAEVIKTIARETNNSETTVRDVLRQNNSVVRQANVMHEALRTNNVTHEQTTKILEAIKETATQTANSTTSKVTDTRTLTERIHEKMVERESVINNNTTTNTNTNTNTATSSNEKITQIPATSTIQQITKTIFESAVNNAPVLTQVSSQTHVNNETIKQIVQSFENNLNQSTNEMMRNISSTTNLSTNQVQHVLQTLSQTITNPGVSQQISQNTNIATSTVQEIAGNIPVILQQQATATPSVTVSNEPIVKIVSYTAGTTEETSQNTVQNLMNAVVSSPTIINNISQETGLQTQQIQNVITTYTQNITKPRDELFHIITQSSGVTNENIQKTLTSITNNALSSEEIVHNVAQQSGVKEEEVTNVMQNQMKVATAPEAHIEKSITMPSSVSIEDYEDVKEMWTKHYEEGDIPVTEQIKTREDWIQQDIVFITNTLNKLLSPDEKLRQEGLDELGYLLPVILINNLKGEELLVYLKAKLEAAKATLKSLKKAKGVNVEEEQEDEEDMLVERTATQEEDKHMEVDEDEEKPAPTSIEDREKATEEKLEKLDNDTQTPNAENVSENPMQESTTLSADPLEDIRQKLADQSQK